MTQAIVPIAINDYATMRFTAGGLLSTDAAVAVQIAAEMVFESLQQAELDLLHFSKLGFQAAHPLLQRIGARLLLRNLALLN